MVVHRFMSDAEYEVLTAGGRLMNGTDHGASGNKSTSIGFCFFSEDPEVAVHWLSGICRSGIERGVKFSERDYGQNGQLWRQRCQRFQGQC